MQELKPGRHVLWGRLVHHPLVAEQPCAWGDHKEENGFDGDSIVEEGGNEAESAEKILIDGAPGEHRDVSVGRVCRPSPSTSACADGRGWPCDGRL